MRAWRQKARGRVEFLPSSREKSEKACTIGGEAMGSVRYVESDGTIRTGAGAVFALMSRCGHPLGPILLWLHGRIAPFRFVSERGYGIVARRRLAISRLLGWLPDRTV